jgi:hypothetical protein
MSGNEDSCADCVYFQPEKSDPDFGRCRRYPPPPGGRKAFFVTWCGEHAPIDEEESVERDHPSQRAERARPVVEVLKKVALKSTADVGKLERNRR